MSSFESARFLSDRAGERFAEFLTDVATWQATQFAFSRGIHPTRALSVVAMDVKSLPGMKIMAKAHDVFMDTRAALDHLAWDMLSREDAQHQVKFATQVYFPIFDTDVKFDTATKKHFPNAPLELIRALDLIQDYRTRTKDLWALNKFAKDERHRHFSLIGVPDRSAKWKHLSVPQGLNFAVTMWGDDLIPLGRTELVAIAWTRDCEPDTAMPLTDAPALPEMPEVAFELGVRTPEASMTLTRMSRVVAETRNVLNFYERYV